MDTKVRDLLGKLSTVRALEAPQGEAGVTAPHGQGATAYLPILSVYLDWRPKTEGARSAERPGRVVLRERLRDIQRALWPRGAAYDAVSADAARIERYLDGEAPLSAHGLAIFACDALNLFETLTSDVPFENEVTAGVTPSLYPLARLMDEQETVVVVVTAISSARLFVSQRGMLRELTGLSEDPKFFSMIKETNAMNQAHYQRYALEQRKRFAREVAAHIAHLVSQYGATQVILAGGPEATPALRAALPPEVAALVYETPLHMDMDAPRDAIWDEIEPMVRETEVAQERSVVARLVESALKNGLAVLGYEQTLAAIQAGQVDTLAISSAARLPEGARSELISHAMRTGASVEIVESGTALDEAGGVGALLRYRYTATWPVFVPPTIESATPAKPPTSR